MGTSGRVVTSVALVRSDTSPASSPGRPRATVQLRMPVSTDGSIPLSHNGIRLTVASFQRPESAS